MYFTIHLLLSIIIILVLILICVLILLVRKKTTRKGKILIIVIMGSISLLTPIFVKHIPFEYNIVSFSSVKEACQYVYPNCEILYTIDAEDCTFVLTSQNYILRVEKSGNSTWKYPVPYLSDRPQLLTNSYPKIQVFKSVSNSQKLIIINFTSLIHSTSHIISDNIGSDVKEFSGYDYLAYYFILVDSDIANYSLTIDSQTYSIDLAK